MEEIEFLKRALKEEINARKHAEEKLTAYRLEFEQARIDLNKNFKERLEKFLIKEQDDQSNLSRLSSLIVNLDSAILLEDENRKIVLVNQKFCDIFGIPVSPEKLIGQDCSSSAQQTKALFKDPELFIERIEEVLSNKKKVLSDELHLVDGRILKRDFIPVWCDNEYLGHLWNYEDLTNYIGVKKKIESLSRFPKESPNPILRCTPEGEVLYANAAAKIFVSALTTSQYNNSLEKAYTSLVSNLESSFKTRMILRNEIHIKDKTFDVSYVPVQNEKYVNIYATDITSNKEAEGKIHLLKELLNQFNEFVQIIDKEGNFIFINESSAKRFQRSVDEIYNINIKDLVSTFYNGMTWEEQFAYFKENENVLLESTHTRPDKTVYPIEASIKHISVHGKEYIISFSKDISERRRIDEALKKQKEFYEDILNNIPSDIAVFNTQYEYLYVNPAGIRDPETRKWIIGKTDMDYCEYKNKDKSLAIQRMNKHDLTHKDKKPIEWEDVFYDKNGNSSYVLRKFHPVLNEEGDIKIIIGYGIDITEIKHVQDKLARSEELYRLVIHAANDGIWDWDIASGNVYLSERWKSMLGYTDCDLENNVSTWAKTMHSDDFPIAKDILDEHLIKHKPFTYTLRFIHKDGSIRWIRCRGYAIRNRRGEAYRMVGSSTDVTDTQIAESKLKENEKKLLAIFNHSHDAKFLVDTETNKIIEFNQRTAELFEADKPESLYNLSPTALRRHPLTSDELKKAEADFKEHGYWNQEVLYKTYKGNEFWGNIIAKIITINNKNVILARITDITENKKNERELIKAKQIAEDSTKAKEMFLANMSHEIRTPMNGILGMTELLSRTALNETQQKHVQLIKNSADNLLVIINDILDMAKIESGKLTIEKIPFDICEVIKNAIQPLVYKAEEKGIELKIHPIQVDHNIVIGDPFRLTQAFLNLINNAIKFTENGSVEISGRIPYSNADEITFEFTIKDTGIGIPQNKLDSIFEGFTQASLDTTRKYGGTGLGLTISKNLIQMQGGNIWVESTVGKGSKFIFSITYEKGMLLPQTSDVKTDISNTNLHSIKILLAEDNEVNQYLAKTLLEEEGIEVDIANNGMEALELFEKNTYDLILMDVQMPYMGGVEATAKIRQHQAKSHIPIIALTANALVGDAEKYISAGMNDYISKPFTREDLFRKIKNHTNSVSAVNISKESRTEKPIEAAEIKHLPDYKHLETNFLNNTAFLKKILTIFIDTTPAMVEELKLYTEKKDYPNIQAIAHKLKASIDSFKIAALHDTIRNIEKYAANGTNLDEIPDLVKLTSHILELAQEDIKKKIQTYS